MIAKKPRYSFRAGDLVSWQDTSRSETKYGIVMTDTVRHSLVEIFTPEGVRTEIVFKLELLSATR
jgi:hypothetical protein|tara:strand:+ start:169 stop:363 length:195 start_codon:yes stop_codon:yes gene_type:complete